jgi:tRNA (guanine-N7-)-methyltransferase
MTKIGHNCNIRTRLRPTGPKIHAPCLPAPGSPRAPCWRPRRWTCLLLLLLGHMRLDHLLRHQERLLLQQAHCSDAFTPPYDYPLQPHPAVAGAALKHAANLERYLASPLHGPTVDAFGETVAWLERTDPSGERPIVLDSGCGTGRSTRLTALAHPGSLVVGVDRSEARLERGDSEATPENALLVRAELCSFWRLLLAEEGVAARVRRHQLLYPNPYPKAAQRGKRWPSHPALPLALQLGGQIEVRSNWLPYLLEFREATTALALALGQSGAVVPAPVRSAAAALLPARVSAVRLGGREEGLTLFEAKYHEKGDRLFKLEMGRAEASRGGGM